LRNLLLTTAALLALGAAPAAGGPAGGTVVGGAATIQGQGGPAMTFNQSSGSAIINWNTFNIGVNESVRFILFGPSAVVNTAGFLATTHDLANADFMAGRYNFQHPGQAGCLDRQSRTHHRHERRLCGAGGARRAHLRHYHRHARHCGTRLLGRGLHA
jgi:hypothetical protein